MNTTKYRIAIAEEQVLFRQGLTNILSNFEDCSIIIQADNGKTLVDQIELAEEKPDVCIFDINMSQINGFETVKIIKEKWPEIKVLILSLYNNIFSVMKLLYDGADGFLLKSCNAQELNKALVSLRKNGYYYPEFISGRMIYLLKNKQHDLPLLTDRELYFLTLCMTDMTYREIADQLCVSTRTVDKISRILFEKIGLKSRTALAVFAVSLGLPIRHVPYSIKQ